MLTANDDRRIMRSFKLGTRTVALGIYPNILNLHVVVAYNSNTADFDHTLERQLISAVQIIK